MLLCSVTATTERCSRGACVANLAPYVTLLKGCLLSACRQSTTTRRKLPSTCGRIFIFGSNIKRRLAACRVRTKLFTGEI